MSAPLSQSPKMIKLAPKRPMTPPPTRTQIPVLRPGCAARSKLRPNQGLPTPKMPHPRPWAANIAKTVIELLTGFRPTSPLSQWLLPEIHGALLNRVEMARRLNKHAAPDKSARVVSAHVKAVQAIKGGGLQAVEAAVVVFDGKKSRAVALRLEPLHGRWVTTALEIG